MDVVILKRLALVTGGLWSGVSSVTSSDADTRRVGVTNGLRMAPLAAAPRRADAFTRLPLSDVHLGGRLGRAIDLVARAGRGAGQARSAGATHACAERR